MYCVCGYPVLFAVGMKHEARLSTKKQAAQIQTLHLAMFSMQ
jgi:hypothetical protein